MNEPQPQTPPDTEPAPQPKRRRFQRFWRLFWQVFLVVSLGYAWYCFYVPANNIAWAGDYATAQQQAAQSGDRMILFFTATWCVPCRIMKRNVWADEQVAATVNAEFVPVMIDVDDPDAAAALSLYHVGATPTTVITDSEGAVLKHVVGGMNKTDFLALLGEVDSSAASVTP